MASRSPSRDRHRSRTRSPTPRSQGSRSPQRRNQHDSRSPARSPSPQRRNGRYRSRSRSRSRSNSRSRSRSPSRSRSRGRERSDRGRSGSPPARSTKIVVERLSKNINESHLQEIFGQFGRIKDLDLPLNRTSGTNRGTAYILYDYEEDAEAAISHMHEAQVDGSAVNVSIVLPRRKLSPAPPTARRGANIDPRVPFSGGRGGPPGAGMGGNNGMSSGRGRRRMSPGSRYGPRSDVYRPGSHSPSRSSAGPTSRSGVGRYRSRSNNSYSSRSRSRSPRRKGTGRHDDHETTRRRGSIDGHGDRSRSRSRGNNPR